jgi:hypothetical protein
MLQYDIFKGVARNVEWRLEGGNTVLTFEQLDDTGNVVASPQVMLRKKKINGSLSNGEEIEMEARMSPDGFLKPRIIFNAATQSFMLPPRMPIPVIAAHLLSLGSIALSVLFSSLSPEVAPTIVLGGRPVDLTKSPPHPNYSLFYYFFACLAIGFFLIAAIWSIMRTRTKWIYKVPASTPKEVQAVFVFSLLNLIGAMAPVIPLTELFRRVISNTTGQFPGRINSSLDQISPFLIFLILLNLLTSILYLVMRRNGVSRARRN